MAPTSDHKPPWVRLEPAILGGGAVLLGLICLLFLLIVSKQREMEQVSADSRDRVVPLILERQRAVVNLERLKQSGIVVIASDDPRRRREALLAAQSLAFHPSFQFDADLTRQVSDTYRMIRQAADLKADSVVRHREAATLTDPEAATAARQAAATVDATLAGLWSEALVGLNAIGDRLLVDVTEMTADRFALIQDRAGLVSQATQFAFVLALAVFGGTGWLVRRHIVSPLVLAANGLRRIGDGARDVALPAARTCEMDSIRRAVESMARLFGALEATQVQLVEKEKMAALGGLVAGVAHEINTPLGNALVSASLLGDRTDEIKGIFADGSVRRSQFAAYLDTADEVSRALQANLFRVDQLVASFKQVAVTQTGEEYQEFVVGAHLEEVMRSLPVGLDQTGPDRTGIRVTLDCPPDLVVRSCPDALGQVLTALTTNALSHAFEPGRSGSLSIRVTRVTTPPSDDFELCFADDGNGIPAEVLPRIFEPFFTTARGRGQTGLGLHIVFNQVAHRLKGRISVTSTPGQGTVFTLRCPRRVPLSPMRRAIPGADSPS